MVPQKPQDVLLIVYLREIKRLEEYFRLQELQSMKTDKILDPVKNKADVEDLKKRCYELLCK
jgi:hypothetical protein